MLVVWRGYLAGRKEIKYSNYKNNMRCIRDNNQVIVVECDELKDSLNGKLQILGLHFAIYPLGIHPAYPFRTKLSVAVWRKIKQLSKCTKLGKVRGISLHFKRSTVRSFRRASSLKRTDPLGLRPLKPKCLLGSTDSAKLWQQEPMKIRYPSQWFPNWE